MASSPRASGSGSGLPVDASRPLHLAIAFCLALMLLKGVRLYLRRLDLVRALAGGPGLPDHGLFGQRPECQPGTKLEEVSALVAQHPYACAQWTGICTAIVSVYHPDYVRTLLSREDPKNPLSSKFLFPWIGKGLLLSNGSKWFQHRKLLAAGFHFDVLKPFVGLMADSATVMLDNWKKLISQEESVEIFQPISLMALDSILKCAYSHPTSCQGNGNSETYTRAVEELTYLTSQRGLTYLYRFDSVYRFTPSGRRFREVSQLAHLHTDAAIQKRQADLGGERELEKIWTKRHVDFLDILLCSRTEKGEELSDADLRAEVDTFIFAGHDTTASGISWTLYALALHPEHQQRCREEAQKILGERDTVQWEDLAHLTYTTMCIKESLRLYPPVPAISRELSSPITFFDGCSLPEGVVVSLNICTLHRNPAVWTDPEVFDPLRFSPEKSSQRHPHAFLPFSAGSRNCIGQQLAMNELKVVVAQTLLHFELSPDPSRPPEPIPQLVLKSKTGIHLLLRKLS
ncbi:cytochrome P450 4A25-like [Ornithorhynchus anatinus]|uniref:Cytochrome P450 family 4 subfamily B member 1 n=1 Tax=Ornithorhynchus anatinus TaxID=9258 RepID=F6SJT0_ORNAN|nr:cytochrome P450 4A25-like [Ornithorhynchus anatinus]